jgi:hypothetical protein
VTWEFKYVATPGESHQKLLFWWAGGEHSSKAVCHVVPFDLVSDFTAFSTHSKKTSRSANIFNSKPLNNYTLQQPCLSVEVDEAVVASPQAQIGVVRILIFLVVKIAESVC